MKGRLSLLLKNDNEVVFNIEDTEYEINNKIIKFIDNEIEFIIDIENKVLRRENNEFLFELDLKNKTCLYKLKETDTMLDIKVLKSEFNTKKDSIIIDYVLESDEKENFIEITIKEGELL